MTVTASPTAVVPAGHSATTGHRARSGVAADLLAVAWAPGMAPPREVRVRPELHARLCAQLGPAVVASGLLGEPAGVPLVVDPGLPAFPGFEVLRVRP